MATVIRKEPSRAAKAASQSTLIGELLRGEGRLSDEDVDKVVLFQQERGIRFGEAAIQLGLLAEDDVNRALSRQFSFAYADVGESGLDESLYCAYEPFGVHAEAMRSLRSALSLRWFTEGRKVLAVLEASRGHGCSSVVANLGISFSQAGMRTLIVDADLRAPAQRQLFGMQSSDGLANLLGGRVTMTQAIREVPSFPRLCVLNAGSTVPNPQELLSRPTFATLMKALSSTFDVVLVDCPAALEFADAQLIAARSGACLMVARKNRARLNDLQTTKQRLAPSGAEILGAVILEN